MPWGIIIESMGIGKMAKKSKRYILAEGYPWYRMEKGCPNQENNYFSLVMYDKAHNFGHAEGTKKVPLKIKWGAWKKVRILIEEVK